MFVTDFQMELADAVEGEGGDVREGRVQHADVFRNLHDFFLLDVVCCASAGICVQIIGWHKPVMLDGIEGMARPVDDDFVADFVVFDIRSDGDDFARTAIARIPGEFRMGVVHVLRPCAFRARADNRVVVADKDFVSNWFAHFRLLKLRVALCDDDDTIVFHDFPMDLGVWYDDKCLYERNLPSSLILKLCGPRMRPPSTGTSTPVM